MRRVLVWDLPVRILHGLLVAGFGSAFVLAELADDDDPLFVVHMVLGLLVAVMTLLRILWGVVGSQYARFSAFSFGPAAVLDYVQSLVARGGRAFVGHNPATSYATLAMLSAVLGLVASGLAMSLGFGEELEELHEVLAFGLLAVALVHVAGVVLHTLHHRDGIGFGMLDGKKLAPDEAGIESSHPVAAAVGLVVTALVALWLIVGYDGRTGSVVLVGTGMALGGEVEDEAEEHHRERDADDDHHHRKSRRHEHDDD